LAAQKAGGFNIVEVQVPVLEPAEVSLILQKRIKKAHIHHKDGNPLHNTWNNFEVLCTKCHGKREKGSRKGKNYYIVVIFKPAFRQDILERAGYRCAECGAFVGDIEHLRCGRCGRVTRKKDARYWQNGQVWCKECFDKC